MANSPIIDLSKKGQEILRLAERLGVEQNYFFITTFQRYQVQIQLLMQLEQQLREDGPMVTKEYVKGRENVYTHPAITDYNRTSTAANQTVQTLIKIIQMMSDRSPEGEQDELLTFLRGRKK